MITFDRVTLTYTDQVVPALHDVTLTIPEGELTLVVGASGSGKTTFLRLINGLVPHFSGGELIGRVQVDDRDTRTSPPRDLADLVGFVGQDPSAGFVTDIVEDELAYGMEAQGIAPAVMRRRVEETLDQLGLAPLRHRPLRTLSGGERQRVAIGAALTAHPRALVLDEPTSALDPGAAEDVLAHVQRLVHDLGMTVVLAEHRLERVIQYADSVIVLPGNAQPVVVGAPADVMRDAPVAPPVVELGRQLNWSPLPLTVRDARRLAAPLRAAASTSVTNAHDELTTHPPTFVDTAPLAVFDRTRVGYGRREVLHGIDLQINRGEIIALMGRNGAGKSTLLAAIAGLREVTNGRLTVGSAFPADLTASELIAHVGLVPQQAGDLLYADTVEAECRTSDRDGDLPAGTTLGILSELAPAVTPASHPGDLSEGQRLCLALAVILAPRPPLVLLDEPTRGLDYGAKTRLIGILRDLQRAGHGIVVATHDVELAAELSTRTVVMAEGVIVADGPTRDIVTASPMFAPQVAKIMAPEPLLTVADVMARLAGAAR